MILNTGVVKEIYSHAVEAYPNECCGIITGKGEMQSVHTLRNIQDELHASDPTKHPRTARIAYAVEREKADKIFKSAKSAGEAIVAFYHSHPDHDAYFSEEDKEAQTVFGEPEFPDALQVVISVKLGMVNGMKCFMWNGKTGDFEEVKV